MTEALNFYQHLPARIDPVAFFIFDFPVRWYSLGYLVGFIVAYLLLRYRIEKGGYYVFEISKPCLPAGRSKSQNPNKFPACQRMKAQLMAGRQNPKSKTQNLIVDLLLYSFVGLLIGARVGYVIFYDSAYFFNHPLESVLPIHIENFKFQISNFKFVGYYGMSYFGGLIGVVLAVYIFSKKHKSSFLELSDFMVPAIPAGYFFGRLGNFLNGELYGRATDAPWGMYFPNDPTGLLRHPSQLYEAFFEGLVLFAILWLLRNTLLNKKESPSPFGLSAGEAERGIGGREGALLAIYFFGYGFFRFGIEFFREPDPQIGLLLKYFTLGQVFSGALIVLSIALFWINRRKVVE